MFDKVIILCEGRLIYDGVPKGIKHRLNRFGYVSKSKPPIEFFLEVVDTDHFKI